MSATKVTKQGKYSDLSYIFISSLIPTCRKLTSNK